jgi:TolA-binding protein
MAGANPLQLCNTRLCTGAIAGLLVGLVFVPKSNYDYAMSIVDTNTYEAIDIFETLNTYEKSQELIKEARYLQALDCFENKKYTDAIEIFEEYLSKKGISSFEWPIQVE